MFPVRVRHSVAALICVMGCAAAQAAAFQDPLTTPAQPVSKAERSRLMSVALLAQGKLVAVGPQGTVLLSPDSGSTWRPARVPLSSDLVAVRFVNANHGWIAGHDGVILHSADGGQTWSKQLDGVAAAQLLQQARASAAVPEGVDATVRAAETQRYVDEGADKPFFDVLFTSEREGFAVGAFNMAFRTEDGGQTWVSLFDRTNNPETRHLYGLADSGSAVYLVGEQGFVRRWRPEQGRFEVLQSPYKGTFFGVLAKGDSVLAFGMRGNAFLSRDAGVSWAQVNTRTSSSLTAGALLPDGRIVLVTQTGQLLLSADGGFNFEPVPWDKPMPLYGVAPLDDKTVVLVGAGGVRSAVIGRKGKSE